MTPDKAALEAQLKTLTDDWTGLQAAVAQREQEIQQIDRRRAQLQEEILRHQGALGYNQVQMERVKKALAEAERSAESLSA